MFRTKVVETKEERSMCKSKAVPLHAMEALWGRGGIAPTHHDLGTRWG
jgi:hypothetical protein